MKKDKIFIGLPMAKNEISATTVVSLFQGTSKSAVVNFQILGLSLLAKNFNILFCNAVMRGYDFFVLHHSDLGVSGILSPVRQSWMELMVQRLLDNKLAALSVVVPIKTPDGITSTGMETIAGDAWSLRRLTIKELEQCPTECINRTALCKLFGLQESEAGALLINTGLLIMDIRNRGGIWREKKWSGFNIVDFLVWNTKGIPESYTIPEDWNFSRWCNDNGVPYAATRELTVTHCGVTNFSNIGGWGIEHDEPRQQMCPEEYEKT